MFSKAVVATDLSKASERMMRTLGSLHALGTRELALTHCINVIDMGMMDAGTLTGQMAESAKPALNRRRKKLQELGFDVTIHLVFGRPDIEINRLAEEGDYPLIVIGSNATTVTEEIFLAGATTSVVHGAKRPVLVLHPKSTKGGNVKTRKDKSLLKHVLFPTDFSDNAEHALPFVQKLVEHGSKRVSLLHVQDESRIGKHLMERLDEFNRIDTARLKRISETLRKQGARQVRIELPLGSPKQEIIKRTGADDVSLVVMGSQGRGYLGDLFLGSVSHAVARRGKTSVLLVPAPS